MDILRIGCKKVKIKGLIFIIKSDKLYCLVLKEL